MDPSRKHLSTSAWGALLQVHAAVVPVLDQKLLAEAGMPLRFYDVLLELAAAPERKLRMSDLADRVVLSRTRVSRLVEEMTTAGLLIREQNPQDGRSAYAALTDLGLRRYRQAAPTYLAGIEEHFAKHLADQDLNALAATLHRVLAMTTRATI
ncbi:MAG: MarR family transcriptional regulator [Mycobacteriales bacterium]